MPWPRRAGCGNCSSSGPERGALAADTARLADLASSSRADARFRVRFAEGGRTFAGVAPEVRPTSSPSTTATPRITPLFTSWKETPTTVFSWSSSASAGERPASSRFGPKRRIFPGGGPVDDPASLIGSRCAGCTDWAGNRRRSGPTAWPRPSRCRCPPRRSKL
jgi:hypothetical protein